MGNTCIVFGKCQKESVFKRERKKKAKLAEKSSTTSFFGFESCSFIASLPDLSNVLSTCRPSYGPTQGNGPCQQKELAKCTNERMM